MEFFSTSSGQILLGIFALINLTAFFVMGYDKRRAVVGEHTDRTPEGFIFFLAAMFGSIGVYAGMKVFRHKIRKWYFHLGIMALLFQNLATLYAIWILFSN